MQQATLQGDIARRVMASANRSDDVPRARHIAEIATEHLRYVPDQAIDEAFRRYTASNRPTEEVRRKEFENEGFWRYQWSLWLIGIGFAASIAVGNWLYLIVGGVIALAGTAFSRSWENRQKEITSHEIRDNPWTFGAEMVGVWNPTAEPGNTRIETRLVGLAVVLAEEIRANRVWNSSILDENNIRIDLGGAVRDVSHRAFRIWEMRNRTGRASGNDPLSQEINQEADRDAAVISTAESALRDRVASLAAHLANIKTIEILINNREVLEQNSSYKNRDLLDQLHRDAALGEMESLASQADAARLHDLQQGMTAQVQYLRDQIARDNYLL